MNNKMEILLAGFGGQGILFVGKFLTYCGLLAGKEVSWLPSYGPEMRGGTASCGVILSDTPIGSPIVSAPDILVALNLPSLDKYENAVVPGGVIIYDRTLIPRDVTRDDVTVLALPATKLAEEHDLKGLSNMILGGAALRALGDRQNGVWDLPYEAALAKTIPPRKAHLLAANTKAIELGKAQ